jgi:hypothetical protein
MSRKFVGVCGLFAMVAVAALPAAAFAQQDKWTVFLYGGTEYGVRNHDTALELGLSEKKAGRVARRLNRAMSKDGGLVDPGSGPCHNPAPGTQC